MVTKAAKVIVLVLAPTFSPSPLVLWMNFGKQLNNKVKHSKTAGDLMSLFHWRVVKINSDPSFPSDVRNTIFITSDCLPEVLTTWRALPAVNQ